MLELFKNPPNEYRPVPIWTWSEHPRKDEVERQIREMHAKGIGGFFIQMPTPSLISDEHNNCYLHAKRIARELGMHLHLYENDAPKTKIAAKEAAGTVKLNSDTLYNARHSSIRSGIGRSKSEPEFIAFSEEAANVKFQFSKICQLQKLESSLVHTKGIGKTVSEITGQADWSQSLKQIKQNIDWFASLGTNVFCPYSFNYSITDSLDIDTPSSQFYQAAYWPHYRLLSNYISRLSYALCQGRHKALVALLYPTKRSNADCSIDIFNVYAEYLLKEHVDYDIIDEESLQQASCIDQRLYVADESYDLLIIPPITEISYGTAVKIQEFGEDGGRILGNVLLPFQDSDGRRHNEIMQIFAELFDKDPSQLYQTYLRNELPNEPSLISHNNLLFLQTKKPISIAPIIRSIVSAAVKPEVSLRYNGSECHDITYIHRVLDDSDVYFFSNNAHEVREVQMTIRCNRAPYMLNIETGDATALPYCTQQGNRTILLHRFEEYGSLLVYFSNDPAFAIAPEIVTEGQNVPMSNEWTFSIKQPNCISLSDWTFNTHRQDEITHCEYLTAFNTETKPDQLLLVMKRMPVKAVVNGAEAISIAECAFDAKYQSIDITPCVQIGLNEIRLSLDYSSASGDSIDFHGARLMGNFSLDETQSILLPPRSTIGNGSWTDQGYPFYSGTAHYRQSVSIPEFIRGQRVILQADSPADLVEFVVNGASAGVRPWAPYSQDITHLVKSGINEIEINVTNSLANMLLQQPKRSGLLGGARIIIC